MRNLEKFPECLQRFHVGWQGKSSHIVVPLLYCGSPAKQCKLSDKIVLIISQVGSDKVRKMSLHSTGSESK
jgi:hypothetical protein